MMLARVLSEMNTSSEYIIGLMKRMPLSDAMTLDPCVFMSNLNEVQECK